MARFEGVTLISVKGVVYALVNGCLQAIEVKSIYYLFQTNASNLDVLLVDEFLFLGFFKSLFTLGL